MADPLGAGDIAPALPLVSVVIPVFNEERHIEACLESVFTQTYPPDRIEIVVADGGSTDGTLAILHRLLAEHPNLRVIDNPRRIQAAGLNRAILDSRGAVVARLDGHAAWHRHHLALCVQLLTETGAENVGGGMTVVEGTPLVQAIGCATASPFGVGGARYRWSGRRQEVETVWLGCFRREALERVGLYDETLDVHEDYELNRRIRAAGGRIVFAPELAAMYCPRDSVHGLARQYFRYGRAKAKVARRVPGVMRAHHFVPPLAVAAGPIVAGMMLSRRRRPRAIAALGAYLMGCVGAAAVAARGKPMSVGIRVLLLFPVIHGSWGLGFWAGLLQRTAPRSVERR